jgi:hypothetical protein
MSKGNEDDNERAVEVTIVIMRGGQGWAKTNKSVWADDNRKRNGEPSVRGG